MVIQFDNTYTSLDPKFYTRIDPTKVTDPQIIYFNFPLAIELGINVEELSTNRASQIFSGNKLLKGSDPAALVYAGHQFGNFVSSLGDGRAILLGEVIDIYGKRRDIQLKGSGKTPYSRGGDGRVALGPAIRECVVSEAMHALGIKTTRCLALVSTGETVLRHTIQHGAILTRVASSHIRIGTFEYFAAKQDLNSLKILTDYTIDRHYPKANNFPNPYQALLEYVAEAQAGLIADWMRVGFIHGVMNTDNMALSGETIDYGPCAFMDEYDANKVFSSIDDYGRYAFNNQATIGLWNFAQLAKSITFLLHPHPQNAMEIALNAIHYFKEVYDTKYLRIMGQKIGVIDPGQEDDDLITSLLEIMQGDEADHTMTFRYLCYKASNKPWPFYELFKPSHQLENWILKWTMRLQSQNTSAEKVVTLMFSLNPALIPRNHIIEKVIQSSIEQNNGFFDMHRMMDALKHPYKDNAEFMEYMCPPIPEERVHQTFCGT